MEESRRSFIRKAALGSAGIALGSRVIGGIAPGFSSRSYGNILGANEKIRVGVVGFSDRFRHSLLPGFMDHAGTLNFEMVALSDIWNRRREEGKAFIKQIRVGGCAVPEQ